MQFSKFRYNKKTLKIIFLRNLFFKKPFQKKLFSPLEIDRWEMRESIRLARAVFSQPSFAPFCAGEMEPGPGYNTDAELDDFAARKGDSSYHPSCTCRMGDSSKGGQDGAVVDAKTMGVIGGFLFPKIVRVSLTFHFRHCRNIYPAKANGHGGHR